MLDNLLKVLKEMRTECQSRPEGVNACEDCPYNEFCGRDCSIFKELPQDFEHPLLDN